MKNPWFRNVEFIKENATKFLSDLGFKDVAYEGAEANLIFGGFVWFQAKHNTDKQLVYTIQLRRQGSTLKYLFERIINPEVKNTVRVKNSN